MPNSEMHLPSEQRLGNEAIAKLSRVFDDTAASYKFLWTFAILKEIETSDENDIQIERLTRTMLRESIFPISRFKLNFGYHDRVEARLKELASMISLDDGTVRDDFDFRKGGSDLTHRVKRIYKEMQNHVPHRWLRPFLDGTIDNPKSVESIAREAIMRFAKKAYDSAQPPPYKLEGGSIVLHPLWRDYFQRNMCIVRGWTLWHWTNYLQAKNPNIPAIATKIGFPESREQWHGERDFWQAIIENAPSKIHCLYSGDLLSAQNFHLDHYIPWSFVGHNRPWNIAPVTEKANEQKGDRLPHGDYFPKFVALHNQAIEIWKKHAPNRFNTVTEAYRVDLQLTSNQLGDGKSLVVALKRTIPPILETAKNNSFESDWRYR